MKDMKRYFKYIVWIVLFYLFSTFMINLVIKHKYDKKENIQNNTVVEENVKKYI